MYTTVCVPVLFVVILRERGDGVPQYLVLEQNAAWPSDSKLKISQNVHSNGDEVVGSLDFLSNLNIRCTTEVSAAQKRTLRTMVEVRHA